MKHTCGVLCSGNVGLGVVQVFGVQHVCSGDNNTARTCCI